MLKHEQTKFYILALLVNASTLKTGTWTIENATATNFQTTISNNDDVGEENASDKKKTYGVKICLILFSFKVM